MLTLLSVLTLVLFARFDLIASAFKYNSENQYQTTPCYVIKPVLITKYYAPKSKRIHLKLDTL